MKSKKLSIIEREKLANSLIESAFKKEDDYYIGSKFENPELGGK